MESYLSEQWKDIPGFEGQYQASDYGRIKSIGSGMKGRYYGKILSQNLSSIGYPTVRLHKNKKTKTYSVHRLVAMSFHGTPGDLLEVDHIDCNKENNQAGNLRWVSRKQNMNFARSTLGNWSKGKGPKGEASYQAKLTEVKVKEIRHLHKEANWSQRDLAIKFGVSQVAILQILKGRTWKHVT